MRTLKITSQWTVLALFGQAFNVKAHSHGVDFKSENSSFQLDSTKVFGDNRTYIPEHFENYLNHIDINPKLLNYKSGTGVFGDGQRIKKQKRDFDSEFIPGYGYYDSRHDV